MTRVNDLLARRGFGVVLFVTFVLFWALMTKAYTHSWQEESRMATVQMLVEQGTFIIDHTEFNRTGDKVFLNGHFYSDKTPALSVAAAGAYAVLHNFFGFTLDPAICVPDEDAAACRGLTLTGARFTAFYWLTLIFIGGSASLLIVLFWRAMLLAGAGGLLATALAVALGLASPIAPYSIVFAGHVPAALCLFAGFMLLVTSSGRQRRESSSQTDVPRNDTADSRWRFFWAGFLVSLSANIDLTLVIFIAVFGLWLLFARRPLRVLLSYVLGALVPFAIGAALNYWAAGTIVPLYFDPKAYDFVGTVLNTTVGGTSGFYSLEFGLRYTYDMFVGQRGVFSFTPMLIFAFGGMLVAFKRRRQRGLIAAVLAGSLVFAAYLILRTDNFGGLAWGTRWFVPLVPVWWYFAYDAYGALRQGRWNGLGVVLFWGAVVLSFLTAAQGLHDAWREAVPLIRL